MDEEVLIESLYDMRDQQSQIYDLERKIENLDEQLKILLNRFNEMTDVKRGSIK